MIAALKNGRLAAAGLDVFDQEPLPREILFGLAERRLSPHNSGMTRRPSGGE